MDTKNSSLKSILSALHAKFAGNQAKAVAHAPQGTHALHAVFFHISEFLSQEDARETHQKLLAQYLKEIFADCVCANYLAFSGLDTPARVLTRRVLELGYIVLAYYDNPAKFWDWNSNDKDISYTELEFTLNSEGYVTFLTKASSLDVGAYRRTIASLKVAYGELSNVVHPKPYNFETNVDDAFDFSAEHLEKILQLQGAVLRGLLNLFFCRFPLAFEYVQKLDPRLRSNLTL